MILITKRGRKVQPVRMGCPDQEGMTDVIYGVDIDSTNRDLFGERVVEQYSINDFAGFLGSYTFPYFPLDK